MKLDAVARRASVVAAAAGWIALLSSPLGVFWKGIFALAILLGPYLASRERAPKPRTWTIATVVFLVILPLDYFILSRSVVIAGAHLLLFLLINRLCQLRSAKEARQVTLLSLLTLMLASVLTLSLWFLVALLVFSIAGTWSLAAGTLAREQAAAGGQPLTLPAKAPWALTGGGLLIFALTCALFVVLPRVRFQAFSGTEASVVNVAGFSDEISLGDIGAVKQNRTPVFRARLLNAPASTPVLWRGQALDEYDSGRWRVSYQEERNIARRRFMTPGIPIFDLREGPREPLWVLARDESLIQQEIVIEPLAENVLFALPHMLAVEGAFPRMTAGVTGAVFFHGRGGRFQYKAYSLPPDRPRRDEPLGVPPEGALEYLQLPDSERAQLTAIANRIVAGAATPSARADRLLAHFDDYEYSLSPPPPQGDPVVDFLTRTKTGYCEHYASAMTLLARATGMPARVATGFAPGEFSDVGDYWLVRQSDAHAWVEIYFEDAGWVPYDPTPPDTGGGASLVDDARRLLDYVRLLWVQRVGEFSMRDQLDMLQRASLGAVRLRARLLAMTRVIFDVRGLAVLAMFIIAAAAIRFRWTRRKSAFGRRPVTGEAGKIWSRVLRRLGRRGYRPHFAETPREFARRVGDPALVDLSRLYSHARYGIENLKPNEINEMKALELRVMEPTASDSTRSSGPSALL